jgi:lysozyme
MTAKVDSVYTMLRRDEGEVLHVYKDHLGFDTIGIGILVDKRKGGGLRPEESAFIFNNRVQILTAELAKRLPFFNRLNAPRQAVLLAMAFQMGLAGLIGFENTLAYIERGQYGLAAANMMRSLWAKQTPERAKRMADQMETGEWQQ